MLDLPCREEGSRTGTTWITPVPSPKMPLSYGIEMLVRELEACSVNTAPLHPPSPRIAGLATLAGRSLQAGEERQTMEFLQETGFCLRELILILKWTRIMERDRVPWNIMEHMFLVQQVAEVPLKEIRSFASPYSGRA